jgi:hypothetical protein
MHIIKWKDRGIDWFIFNIDNSNIFGDEMILLYNLIIFIEIIILYWFLL